MATAADSSSKTTDIPATGKKKRRSPLVMTALVGVLAAAVAGSGVWYYSQHLAPASSGADRPAPPPPALYMPLEPAFVVNLPYSFDGPRYLQVEVQLMTRDAQSLEKLRANSPAIRARLLMFFSQIDPASIDDRAGLEKLQDAALAEVNELMTAETGKPSAQALLFTSFVTQ